MRQDLRRLILYYYYYYYYYNAHNSVRLNGEKRWWGHYIRWYQIAKIFGKRLYFKCTEDFDVHIHCKY